MTPSPCRDPESGLTLIEVLVALTVFALIGAAGFAMLDSLLAAQGRTQGRLDELARIQRVLYIVSGDITQAAGGSIRASRNTFVLRRQGGSVVTYSLDDRALVRQVALDNTKAPVRQVLMTESNRLSWRPFHREFGWGTDWPPSADRAGTGHEMSGAWHNPGAVEFELGLDGANLRGTLYYVAIPPAEVMP